MLNFTFRFPKYEAKRKIWENKINEAYKQISRKQMFSATNSSRICSKHFSVNSYAENLKRHFLKPEAVPSIFVFKDQPLKEQNLNECGKQFFFTY